jgi:hypothetical protein
MTHLPSKKLSPKRYGPFTISTVISPINFRLNLPQSWKVHSTFHASELSSFKETEVHGPNFPEPPPDIVNGEEEHKVEAILTHKGTSRHRFLVSWKGYSSADNSWIPEKELANATEILKNYKKCLRLSHLLSESI